MFYSVGAVCGALGFLCLYACDGKRCMFAICVSAINTNQMKRTAMMRDFNKLANVLSRTQTTNKCSFTIYYSFIDREMTFAHKRVLTRYIQYRKMRREGEIYENLYLFFVSRRPNSAEVY